MFSIDDRAGNVMTTIILFSAAGVVLYLARGAFLILLLSIFFAYLLEPAVSFIERHSRLGRGNRSWAIVQVYAIGVVLAAGIGYALGPHVTAQFKSLNASVPHIVQGLSDGKAAAELEAEHVVSAAQQQKIHDWLTRNQDSIVSVFERGAASAGSVAASAVWLFAIPILAIFLLRDGRRMMDSMIQNVGPQGEVTVAKRILRRVDTMLGRYMRAQFALSGLSFVFYSISLALLGFPYAIALGLLGGALEFVPVVGWIVAAATFLTIGFLTHAHWIWMAGLVLLWRLLQNYVNSPRIMGTTVELQPLTVLVALMVGGQVGGIAGVYLSVPVVAALRIVWLEFSSRVSSPPHVDQPIMRAKTTA
jgi:predicted PurR-regulated permease PerM